MDIHVAVGTAEQKKLIEKELSILESSATGAGITQLIERVVVPADFEAAVREATGDPEFRQDRGYHLVLAKIVEGHQGTIIVMSPLLFTKRFDTQIRVSFYLHELSHVFHKSRFPVSGTDSLSERLYSRDLYLLFDEYGSERFALEACGRLFAEPSELYTSFHRAGCAGFFEALDSDETYRVLASAVVRFRLRMTDITGYQRDVQPALDKIWKSLAFAGAYVDSGTRFHEESLASTKARFVVQSARDLVSYFARKYQAGDFDLSDGMDQTRAFAQTFGFIYEDTPEGLYCRVTGVSLQFGECLRDAGH